MSVRRFLFVCVAFTALAAPDGPRPAAAAPPHDMSNGVACVDCHAAGPGRRGPILPRGAAQAAVCHRCHQPGEGGGAMGAVAMHVVQEGLTVVDCGSCHDVHGPQTTTDPHAGGATAPNLALVRGDTGRYVAGALEPALFQRRPDHFAFGAGAAPYNGVCQSCHTRTAHHRNDGSVDTSHGVGADCLVCHPHESGFRFLDHAAAGYVTLAPACAECHGENGAHPVDGVHGGRCGLCHVDPQGAGPLVAPYETDAPGGGDCVDCHGTFDAAHAGASHDATPGSGPVLIFADDEHDDAGWVGERPYFDVTVSCALCHVPSLTAAHGAVCATCHPAAVAALEPDGPWDGSCQQGACHGTIHARSTDAHWPFGDPYDPGNDCDRCHAPGVGPVYQESCLNCHAAPVAGDTTPPVTTADVLASYVGPAWIEFSVRDGGKVGVGTTFHALDGGATLVGGHAFVEAPGDHTLAFWSVDQFGNVESPANEASFTVIEDTTPPVTTSNARTAYWQGARIVLTATDASTLGVRTTWSALDDGPAVSGRLVQVPAVEGVVDHTLRFWSVDWAGNVEPENTVRFTVTSGDATIRLVWGDSDVSGPPTHPDAWAEWFIRRGGRSGPLVASGSGSNPGWSGVDDELVPVSSVPYHVDIWWWDTRFDWDDNTVYPEVYLTTPGELVRLSY